MSHRATSMNNLYSTDKLQLLLLKYNSYICTEIQIYELKYTGVLNVINVLLIYF